MRGRGEPPHGEKEKTREKVNRGNEWWAGKTVGKVKRSM